MRAGVPHELTLADAVAVIDESRCIGCTLCIQVCPVDAIVGAAKLMHTVIASDCTGCELCMAPCPVDCIVMQPFARPEGASLELAMGDARCRCEARNLRLKRAEDVRAAEAAARREAGAERRKRETLARALERARLRLQRPARD